MMRFLNRPSVVALVLSLMVVAVIGAAFMLVYTVGMGLSEFLDTEPWRVFLVAGILIFIAAFVLDKTSGSDGDEP